MKKILVFGATGMIGQHLTQELINDKFDVCIAARNPEMAAIKFPRQKIFKVDVLDPITILQAIEGIDIVLISLSPDRKARKLDKMSEREGIQYIVQACKKANIKRIALVSSLVQRYEGINNFHWWVFQMKIQAVDLLKDSGIPYSIFYPSTIMETIDRDIIQGKKILLAAGSVAKMWPVAATDFGRQVARALNIAGDNNQEYTIQGPEAYDWEEIALQIKQHYDPTLKIVRAPIWAMKFAGLFSQTFNYAAHICEALNKYPEQFESEKSWNDLGKPTTTLRDYLSTRVER